MGQILLKDSSPTMEDVLLTINQQEPGMELKTGTQQEPRMELEKTEPENRRNR